jgi:hypothetical protein
LGAGGCYPTLDLRAGHLDTFCAETYGRAMRIESSVTALSWIPSEAVKGMMKMPFEMGMARYDPPPPEALEDIDALNREGRFRLANRLHAWIEVGEDGRITGYGQDGHGYISVTEVKLGPIKTAFAPVPLPDLQPEPAVLDGSVRFVQTCGGRTGAAMPRRVRHRPFVQVTAPWAWTTLALTIHADGTVEREVVGASPFPRHWIYDENGALCVKSGLVDFSNWAREAYWRDTPWGDVESPALVTAVETALERELSSSIMRPGASPRIRELAAGEALVRQGEEGSEMFLLLDGVLVVEVDGEPVTELGPGAVLGERAVLEGGVRTSSLIAVTRCRVAAVSADLLERSALEELAAGHRREAADQPAPARG